MGLVAYGSWYSLPNRRDIFADRQTKYGLTLTYVLVTVNGCFLGPRYYSAGIEPCPGGQIISTFGKNQLLYLNTFIHL